MPDNVPFTDPKSRVTPRVAQPGALLFEFHRAACQLRTKVLRAFEAVCQAFPDLSVKIEDIVAERDLVAARGTWTGTHKGPFMNFPPTNRTTAASGMVFWRIRNGQIVERWGNLDRLSLQRQLSAES